jgi:hypothetical protein
VSVPYPEGEVGAGWRLADESRETLFSVSRVTVTAATRVYEDQDLRSAVREATGLDRTWRFLFASRLVLNPEPPASGALRRLVTDRAKKGFAGRLADRGFEDVRNVEDRRFAVDGTDATLHHYEATVAEGDGPTLVADGWVAVWPDGARFLLAGGAYPRRVDDDGGDPGAAATLREFLDPGGFREDLLTFVRGTA